MLSGLEERIGKRVDPRERIVSFMPEYAAYLSNRLHQGADGRVPHEKMKGKKPTVLGVDYFEKVVELQTNFSARETDSV